MRRQRVRAHPSAQERIQVPLAKVREPDLNVFFFAGKADAFWASYATS